MKNSLFLLIFASFIGMESQALRPSYKSHKKKDTFSGDMRLRYHHAFEDSKTVQSGYFIRVRGHLNGAISDRLRWDFGMASEGLLPTSRDQRLGGFGGKPLLFDKAALTYYTPVKNFRILVGKMNNPYFDKERYNLIWDEDLKPEGLTTHYHYFFSDKYRVMLHASAFLRDPIIEAADFSSEKKAGAKQKRFGSDRAVLFAGSADFLMNKDNYNFKTGAAFYSVKTEGEKKAVTGSPWNPNSPAGDKHSYDHSILDIFVQMKLKSLWKPISLSGQLVQNLAIQKSLQDSPRGWITGVRIGKNNGKGSGFLDYHYFSLEEGAHLAQYTDSDIGGEGSRYGHQIQGRYKISDASALGLKYILRKDKNKSENKVMNHVIFASYSVQI